ncbi:hypothetical protein B0H63DRAFT_488211 [Podospora didyma]|uniref:Uncharacterized protein n=1 Tax=Podospora didyma TaxID=330526 RepID=A0AAE0K1M6_9PEZI|nr:hypothetical protein B0H63DRAFT_488211 [Podospora didyma]
MGDTEWCEKYPSYQSVSRTILEILLCILIVASYVPQYVSIVSHGTHAISSRFILFHGLFSVLVFGLRLQIPAFYDAFNCVDGGPYTGWKALSSLLGFIQSAVQFASAMLLVVLYVKHRTPSLPDEPSEAPMPGIPSQTIARVISTTAIVVLPISLAFLWCNQYPAFDRDDETKLGNIVAVYGIGLGIWGTLLLPANLVFLVLQFVYQIETIGTLSSTGTLSLISLLLQAVVFTTLAFSQTMRSWSAIVWPSWPDFNSLGRLFEWFLAFYYGINTHVAYLLVGIGFVVLFVFSLLEGRRNAPGAIQLDV